MKTTLGGIFLYSENPKYLAEWYSSNFGLEYEYAENHQAYYVSFPYKSVDGQEESYSVFSILYNKHRPFVDVQNILPIRVVVKLNVIFEK